MIGVLVLSGCGRLLFDPTTNATPDASSAASGDGEMTDGASDGESDALVDSFAGAVLVSGDNQGPLAFGDGCFSVDYYRTSLYGDLAAQTTQTQEFQLARPAALQVYATDTTGGQPKMVVVTLTDSSLSTQPLSSDGTNQYGALCLPSAPAGTYTVTIANQETSQIARQLYIGVIASEITTCPNPFSC